MVRYAFFKYIYLFYLLCYYYIVIAVCFFIVSFIHVLCMLYVFWTSDTVLGFMCVTLLCF